MCEREAPLKVKGTYEYQTLFIISSLLYSRFDGKFMMPKTYWNRWEILIKIVGERREKERVSDDAWIILLNFFWETMVDILGLTHLVWTPIVCRFSLSSSLEGSASLFNVMIFVNYRFWISCGWSFFSSGAISGSGHWYVTMLDLYFFYSVLMWAVLFYWFLLVLYILEAFHSEF